MEQWMPVPAVGMLGETARRSNPDNAIPVPHDSWETLECSQDSQMQVEDSAPMERGIEVSKTRQTDGQTDSAKMERKLMQRARHRVDALGCDLCQHVVLAESLYLDPGQLSSDPSIP
jgi:hypothetical protein